MSKLAIEGGTPVFGGKQLMELVPPWPPRYPETEEKLLQVFGSGNVSVKLYLEWSE